MNRLRSRVPFLLSFVLLLVFLFFFLFVLFVIKTKVEKNFEGIDEDRGTYDDTVKEHNTEIDCDKFCKNLSSPEKCVSFNGDKIQKCLNKNKALISPKCHFEKETNACMNAK